MVDMFRSEKEINIVIGEAILALLEAMMTSARAPWPDN